VHGVRAVFFYSHALHEVLAVCFGYYPTWAGAVPGVVAYLVAPVMALAFGWYVLVLAHGGMVWVVGEFANLEGFEIVF